MKIKLTLFILAVFVSLSSCYRYFHGGPFYDHHSRYSGHHMYYDEDRGDCGRMMGYSIEMGYHVDSNDDGKISREEWSAHFNAMDTDKDGLVTDREWDEFRKDKGRRW